MPPKTWSHAPRSASPRSAAHHNRRRTIGLIIDQLVDGYQRVLFESMTRTARDANVDLVAYVGGRLPSDLYDLVSKQVIEGLVVVSNTLSHDVGDRGLQEFTLTLPPVPIVSVGIPVEGSSSICINGSPGTSALVMHLITEHRRRRLAFINGPGIDGRERYEAFARTLNEFGVPLSGELLVDSNFTEPGGVDAVRTLLDDRKVEFDAIVAGNDFMALGAMAELQRRGIRVPEDVSVIGFDDVEASRHAVVPLTTVQQPIRELGRRAVRLLIRQMTEDPGEESQTITCHPVKRKSCGCLAEAPFVRRPGGPASDLSEPLPSLFARRELVVGDLLRAAQGELGSVPKDWAEQLFDSLTQELRGAHDDHPFARTNDELSALVYRTAGDLSTWQRVLSTLRHHVVECVGGRADLRGLAERALHEAMQRTTSVVGREGARRRAALELAMERGASALQQWLSNREASSAEHLSQYFRAMQLPSAYVSLFTEGGEKARLLVAHDQHLPVSETPQALLFDAVQLLPAALRPSEHPTVLVVFPLRTNGKLAGITVLEYGEDEAVLYTTLQAQVQALVNAFPGATDAS